MSNTLNISFTVDTIPNVDGFYIWDTLLHEFEKSKKFATRDEAQKFCDGLNAYVSNVPKIKYALYDTQMNDFRAFGVFDTARDTLECGSDHFVNCMTEEEYEETGGEDFWYHATAEHAADYFGFTAVPITEGEAKLIQEASDTDSSIYYHDCFTGIGETYKKFPSISCERCDYQGKEI